MPSFRLWWLIYGYTFIFGMETARNREDIRFSAGLFVSCFKTKIETRDDSVLMSPLSLLVVISVETFFNLIKVAELL